MMLFGAVRPGASQFFLQINDLPDMMVRMRGAAK
jgi:hypothetical protein